MTVTVYVRSIPDADRWTGNRDPIASAALLQARAKMVEIRVASMNAAKTRV